LKEKNRTHCFSTGSTRWKNSKKSQQIIGSTFVDLIRYDSEPGPTGWCATCKLNATAGQPGFCDRPRFDEITDEELPQPTPTSGWGYCHSSCKGWDFPHCTVYTDYSARSKMSQKSLSDGRLF
jgi:hypothetical protein